MACPENPRLEKDGSALAAAAMPIQEPVPAATPVDPSTLLEPSVPAKTEPAKRKAPAEPHSALTLRGSEPDLKDGLSIGEILERNRKENENTYKRLLRHLHAWHFGLLALGFALVWFFSEPRAVALFEAWRRWFFDRVF